MTDNTAYRLLENGDVEVTRGSRRTVMQYRATPLEWQAYYLLERHALRGEAGHYWKAFLEVLRERWSSPTRTITEAEIRCWLAAQREPEEARRKVAVAG